MSKKIADMIRALEREINYRNYEILHTPTQTGHAGKILRKGKVIYISPNMPSKLAVELHCKSVIQVFLDKE